MTGCLDNRLAVYQADCESDVSTVVFPTSLAAPGSPEYDPCSEIDGEVLEPVFNIGRYKKAITRFERMTVSVNHKLTCSPVDEIDFILFMWSLRIIANGSVVLNRHRAMSEGNGKSLAHRPLRSDGAGNAGKYFFYGCLGFQRGS